MNHNAIYFNKVLVPIINGCESDSALATACMVAGNEAVLLTGIVAVPEDESLSTAAVLAQSMRRTLQLSATLTGVKSRMRVRASHQPWEDLVKLIKEERPDLLVLEWPCHFEALGCEPGEILANVPCDIAVVRGPVPSTLSKILVPMRGGPYSELALRLALAINSQCECELTTLHMTSAEMSPQQDAPFKGLAQVLANLPEIKHLEITNSNPAEIILREAQRYDLVVMGVSAQSPKMQPGLGEVVQNLLNHSSTGLIMVKTERAIPAEFPNEMVSQAAISVLVDRWFAENTFFADEFQNLDRLFELKRQQNLQVSLALPALNEEKTIGNVIRVIKTALMDEIPLIDEMVVMDSNSTDKTRQIAQEMGIPVYIHQQVLPQYGARSGKGEALWKSLYVTHGDIVLWVDTDIENIHPRFIYGLLGALLSEPDIHFVKGFYRRPIKIGDKIQAGGGGRVTELTARPLLNMFYPELSGLVQPLSGEYGGRRVALEQIPFFSGYGVEIGMVIDFFECFGLEAIAQVDLLERIHHNQSLEALSKMSFSIIQAVLRKLENRFGMDLLDDLNKTMKLIRYKPGRFFLDVEEIAEKERPPIVTLPEYQEMRSR